MEQRGGGTIITITIIFTIKNDQHTSLHLHQDMVPSLPLCPFLTLDIPITNFYQLTRLFKEDQEISDPPSQPETRHSTTDHTTVTVIDHTKTQDPILLEVKPKAIVVPKPKKNTVNIEAALQLVATAMDKQTDSFKDIEKKKE